jgi:hypothetical protein
MKIEDGRAQTPTRFRRCRADARIGPVRLTIARLMGFPPEAILLVAPNGRRVRSDASVAHLRRLWEQ